MNRSLAKTQTFKRLLVPSDLRLKVEDKDLGKYCLTKHTYGESVYYIFDGTYAIYASFAKIV